MTTNATSADLLRSRIADVLVDRLGLLPEEVVPGARFREDLGMDSLDMVELLTVVEEELGGPLDSPEDTLASLDTIGDVVDFLLERGVDPGAGATAGSREVRA
ncbi:acyl carrier protein [Streptomyces sp. NBC_01198]|uniref:acyl carrier protein n=1 Tax=Streptomyces sp. NBC_01198 TaxID=2903769 RepID=UPI002E13DDF6|nr:acyl carrier protein [Streptomyces sp. NBC_01198]